MGTGKQHFWGEPVALVHRSIGEGRFVTCITARQMLGCCYAMHAFMHRCANGASRSFANGGGGGFANGARRGFANW